MDRQPLYVATVNCAFVEASDDLHALREVLERTFEAGHDEDMAIWCRDRLVEVWWADGTRLHLQ
jgi:hypothetical protein